MPKYTYAERELIKDIVASLTIKRIPELEILAEVYKQTDKTLSRSGLHRVKASIKKQSYQWYTKLRQDRYAYIHEYRERIQELLSLQQKHHEIIKNNEHKPAIQQTSLQELHKISITLSNFHDVASDIVNSCFLTNDFKINDRRINDN